MIDAQTYLNEQCEKGYHHPYTVQLLVEKDVKLNPENLPEKFVVSDPEPIENALQIFSPALIQTWDWPDAEEAVSKTKALIEISDGPADALDRKDRLQNFHNAVQALLRVVQPVAIHWLPSQRIVNPQRYIEDLAEGGLLFSSAVNVRMFKIEQSAERIMDTMGLTALGCWDLQSHFINLDPSQMGLYLYHLAEYVFERGDVIRDGDSVEGLQPTERWKCRKESSYVPPTRRVINVTPGAFAPTS
ncbi:MAG TPA: DUF4261 domain-containing protein [Acidobacteriota bacterium]